MAAVAKSRDRIGGILRIEVRATGAEQRAGFNLIGITGVSRYIPTQHFSRFSLSKMTVTEEPGQFPNRIRAVRVAKGLDMAELARMAGISSSYLGMIERGSRVANNEVLVKLAEQLQVRTNDLLSEGLSATAHSLWKHLVAQNGAQVAGGDLALSLKSFRASRNLSVRALCEGPDGVEAGLKAWLVREFEIGARLPTAEELLQLAKAFGYATADEFRAALDEPRSDDLMRSENKGARRLAYDRSSTDWPDLVLKATSKGFTSDQMVIDGRRIPSSFVALGAKILIDRSVEIVEGDLVLVVSRSVVTGMGRIKDGVARDEQGAELKGSPWRVVSMLFP